MASFNYIIWSALWLRADDGELLSLLRSVGEGHRRTPGDRLAIRNDAELPVQGAYPAVVYWLEARHTEAAHFDIGLRARAVVLYSHTVLWLASHNPIRVSNNIWQVTNTLGITCKYKFSLWLPMWDYAQNLVSLFRLTNIMYSEYLPDGTWKKAIRAARKIKVVALPA